MKETSKKITVDKTEHDVKVQEYESFEELMTSATAQEILEAYNFRYQQLQVADHKKRIKPRRIPIKEKRMLGFNMFTEEELSRTTQNAGLFEDIMEFKLKVVEEMISKGEII